MNRPGGEKSFLHRFHASALPARAPGPASGLSRLHQRFERLRERSSALLAPHDSSGIFRQLLLDERPPENRGGMLRLLGFVHLLSATGIHLYALADLWSGALRFLATTLGIPVRIALPISRALAITSWCFAWLLAGGRPGMLRPWLVVMARKTGEALGFRWRKWSPLAWALLIDVAAQKLLRPDSPWETSGRILYALAVGGGMLALTSGGSRLLAHARLAISSWIFTALWEAQHDGLTALATPLLSLVTIPFFSLALFPSLCLSPLFSSTWLWDGATQGVLWLAEGCMRAATVWVVSSQSLLPGALLSALLLAATPALSFRARWSSIIASLLLAATLGRAYFASVPAGPSEEGEARAASVELLDVGQGDAALIRERSGRAGLIDTGGERALSEDAWLRLLASRGLTRLHWIALTHLDEDHSGAVRKLGRLVPIDCLATSRAELETERGRAYAAEVRRLGIRVTDWEGGCVPFPARELFEKKKAGPNALMSALWIPLQGGGYFLSAGDADPAQELRAATWARTLSRELSRPAPAILKLSHHGSRHSNTEAFLSQVRPTEAWVSAGVGNRYGHPAAEVLEKLTRLQISLRRTDQNGIITH
ncbi:MAG: MBL fold metallo-hydrolase [Oligoflexia bacterium]|nr:MBL fold metallo-hydrolase [Oligoflexia bacterium]